MSWEVPVPGSASLCPPVPESGCGGRDTGAEHPL